MDIEFQILIIIFIHWIADFLCQSEEMAINKSKSNFWLFIHAYVYSCIFFFIGCLIFLGSFVLGAPFLKIHTISLSLFFLITFVCHYITDYFTSKWTSKLYKQKKFYGFPAFFSVIGFDQVLHYIQLILTYKYIFL